MLNSQTLSQPALFTLGEIRLLKTLYHELSTEELAIFFRKSPNDIKAIAQELDLKKEEVSHA